MSNNIELRHLRYFSILAEELHFRRAAERLYITQPGLSRQIISLEESLGVRLFNRNKKSVNLTQAGVYFKDETDFILNHLHHVSNQIKAIDAGRKGEVRIGFVGSAMQKVIPEILIKLNKNYPGINATLDELTNQRQIYDLIHDRLDVGFLRIRRIPEDLKLLPVYTETFSLVLPVDHIINSKNFKNVAQLKAEPFILFSRDYSPEYYSMVMSIFEDHGFTPNIHHKSVHANTIYRLVENGLGIAIVPTSLAEGFDLKIKFIELIDIPQRTTLYLCWKHLNRNPAMKSFLSVIDPKKEMDM